MIVGVVVVVRVVVIMVMLLLGRRGTVVDCTASGRQLDLTAHPVSLPIVEHDDRVEPAVEERIRTEIVGIGRTLEQPDTREHLELFAPLVEVYQTFGYRVGDGRVDHGQIREECAEVRDGSVADILRKRRIVIYHRTQAYKKDIDTISDQLSLPPREYSVSIESSGDACRCGRPCRQTWRFPP